ncbi:MAG: hypothetical protein Q4G64_09490 [bacterium]|nr:hypothetical protein [bacterium]
MAIFVAVVLGMKGIRKAGEAIDKGVLAERAERADSLHEVYEKMRAQMADVRAELQVYWGVHPDQVADPEEKRALQEERQRRLVEVHRPMFALPATGARLANLAKSIASLQGADAQTNAKELSSIIALYQESAWTHYHSLLGDNWLNLPSSATGQEIVAAIVKAYPELEKPPVQELLSPTFESEIKRIESARKGDGAAFKAGGWAPVVYDMVIQSLESELSERLNSLTEPIYAASMERDLKTD